MEEAPKSESVITIDGKKRLVFVKDWWYCWNGSWYMYLGHFNSKDEVPNVMGLYSISDKLYRRYQDPEKMQRFSQSNKLPREKAVSREDDESRPLRTDIYLEDNELMVIIKERLKGYTLQQFKDMYNDISDMNNARRTIEYPGQGNLSWNRFKDILGRSHANFEIIVYADDAGRSR